MTFYPACGILKTANAKGKNAVISIDRFEEILGELAEELPAEFSTGIPLQLLSNRPDVKAAEMSLAASYYDTNSARAAFYPQITLSGSAGWTNSAGSAIVNPGKLLASVH